MAYTEVFPMEIRQGASLSGTYMLLLALPKDGREIPVVIGENEAEAVMLAIQNIQTERPMTHQLMCNIMHEYGLSLTRVTIDRFAEGVFYSTLTVSDGFNEKKIDSRTSDAIVLSLAFNAPIFANDAVIDETAIEPLILDGQGSDQVPSEPTLEQLGEKLQECLENEDYEQAAEIQSKIDKLIKEKNDSRGNSGL